MDDMNSRIKKLRLDKAMTLNQFGETIGYSKTYLSYIESDERPITDALATKIMDSHCVRKEWLIYGNGEMYDEEKAALRELYLKFREIVKRYPQGCEHLRAFLLPNVLEERKPNGSGLTIWDRFPGLTIQKFYNSEIEPRELMRSLVDLYKSIETVLNAWVKSVKLIKDPSLGFAEFYTKNDTEKAMIDKIESTLLETQNLVVNNRTIMESNMDNNELLEIDKLYALFSKQLSYKDNLKIIEFIRKKVYNP